MGSTTSNKRVLVAPGELGLESRLAFRREAAEYIDAMQPGSSLVVDLHATQSVDSAGLGALMLIQRRAAARRISVRLIGLNEELRFLLTLTKLDDLFELNAT